MEQEKTIRDAQTEDFSFGSHALKALMAAGYYLLLYIPFILPYIIWGKAATRLALVWDSKSIAYNENDKIYPLHTFIVMYYIYFIFDAVIFLSWILGLLFALFSMTQEVSAGLMVLIGAYVSVIGIKAAKEVFYFILNHILVALWKWILNVVSAIGRFWIHVWGLNFVYR
ncbi:MAG: hypothetical protein RL059_422, partial [Bacteroidota bacterium]